MHPGLAHPIDRSILAPSIAPHTLESREGDDSCKTRVSLGGAISKILGALVLRVGGRVSDGSLRYRGMISFRKRRPYLMVGHRARGARLGEQSHEH
jgi:hypothetical protein